MPKPQVGVQAVSVCRGAGAGGKCGSHEGGEGGMDSRQGADGAGPERPGQEFGFLLMVRGAIEGSYLFFFFFFF